MKPFIIKLLLSLIFSISLSLQAEEVDKATG